VAFNAIINLIHNINLFEQLPEGVQLAKDTKLALTKAAKVFILYVTAWYVIILKRSAILDIITIISYARLN